MAQSMQYWIIVNPVVLGNDKPLFKGINDKQNLKLLKTKIHGSAVAIPTGKEEKKT